jgi:hypothetical protein
MQRALHTATAWSLAALAVVAVPQYLVRPRWPEIVSALSSSASFLGGSAWFRALAAGAIGTNLALVLLFNAALLPIYWSGAWDSYRCDASKPWPWRSAEPEERAAFFRTVRTSLPLVAFNAVAVAFGAIAAIAPIAQLLGSFSIDAAAFPGTPELLAHLAAALVVEDLMFYATHRALHSPWLYAHVHKVHHAYSSVIALSSEHAHPLEYAVGNLLPVTLGPLLLRSHLFTFCLVRGWARRGAARLLARGNILSHCRALSRPHRLRSSSPCAWPCRTTSTAASPSPGRPSACCPLAPARSRTRGTTRTRTACLRASFASGTRCWARTWSSSAGRKGGRRARAKRRSETARAFFFPPFGYLVQCAFFNTAGGGTK